jgi:hypothetical protein
MWYFFSRFFVVLGIFLTASISPRFGAAAANPKLGKYKVKLVILKAEGRCGVVKNTIIDDVWVLHSGTNNEDLAYVLDIPSFLLHIDLLLDPETQAFSGEFMHEATNKRCMTLQKVNVLMSPQAAGSSSFTGQVEGSIQHGGSCSKRQGCLLSAEFLASPI